MMMLCCAVSGAGWLLGGLFHAGWLGGSRSQPAGLGAIGDWLAGWLCGDMLGIYCSYVV